MKILSGAIVLCVFGCLALAALLFCWIFKGKEIKVYDKVRNLTIDRVTIMNKMAFVVKRN